MQSEPQASGRKSGLLERFLKTPLFRMPSVEITVERPTQPQSDVRDAGLSIPLDYPQSFAEYRGQDEIKSVLQVEVASALRKGRPLAHVLLTGPPGTGKTALAYVLAAETGAALYPATGAEYTTQQDILLAFARIGTLHDRDHTRRNVIWLLDELDAIPRVASYSLHTLMSHGYVYHQGTKYGLVPVTIIGTTNHSASVHAALKDRFQIVAKLDYYTPEELADIAVRAAHKEGITLAADAAEFLSLNAAGSPRTLLRRLLPPLANLLQPGQVADLEVAQRAFKLSALRPGGLTKDQFHYLEFLADSKDRTASAATLASYVAEPLRDLQEEVEPYIIRQRFITITSKGRQLSDRGAEYLKLAEEVRAGA